MKRISRVLIVFSLAMFLLLTTVSIAPAVEAGPFYVGVFGGYVKPADMNFEIEDGDADIDIDLDDSWAVGAKIGYIFPHARWWLSSWNIPIWQNRMQMSLGQVTIGVKSSVVSSVLIT